MKIAYTVSCTFTDPAVAERWLAWLRDEHLAEVCAAGALEGRALRLDGDPLRCEARYLFASRQEHERYCQHQAPRLQAEGLARFPLALGLSTSRSVAEVVAEVVAEAVR